MYDVKILARQGNLSPDISTDLDDNNLVSQQFSLIVFYVDIYSLEYEIKVKSAFN